MLGNAISTTRIGHATFVRKASISTLGQDLADAYEKAGRTDLVEKELQEREFVMTYLPEQLDDDIIQKIAQRFRASSAA